MKTNLFLISLLLLSQVGFSQFNTIEMGDNLAKVKKVYAEQFKEYSLAYDTDSMITYSKDLVGFEYKLKKGKVVTRKQICTIFGKL